MHVLTKINNKKFTGLRLAQQYQLFNIIHLKVG